ncbi:restriction endonuclease subunit S [Faecalibacterium prausnitzii]|uniref:restriction endonuclease subunit S n=1 Tax=Faecalibacterium prausnitzii TaxID=853 RepID=UPI0022E2C1C6|nr:restriction endonuclease subunit S [Faecalibacterium prausnitzii]
MILSDVCEFIVDCPHSTAPDERKGYPLIRTPNVGKGRLDLNGVHRVSESVYKQRIQRGAPRANDLIFAREAPAGNVALVQENQTVCLGQRTVLIRPNVQKVNPQYLVYYLLSPKPQYELLGTANDATVAHVNLPAIRNLKIELPEKSVQDKIGTILVSYDDLIENNQKQIKLLEEAAQRLYKEWFVDLRFPGHENTKIVDGVPEGWNECTVESFGTVITGKTPPTSNKEYYTNGKVPFVTIPDMHNVVYPLKTEKRLTIEGAQTQKNKYIPPNSVMISCIGTVGLVSIATEVCQTNQQINSIILNNEDDLYFFYESMLRMKDLLDGLGSNGATMTNVNKSKLEKLIIISPSKDIVKQYNDVCKPLFESTLNLSRKNVYLKNMREALLPKLMSGEVEV